MRLFLVLGKFILFFYFVRSYGLRLNCLRLFLFVRGWFNLLLYRNKKTIGNFFEKYKVIRGCMCFCEVGCIY